MAKVFWTTREWELMAAYLLDHGISLSDRGLAPALRAAQESVLPKERHRAIGSGGAWLVKKAIVPYLEDVKRKRELQPEKKEEDKPAAEPTLLELAEAFMQRWQRQQEERVRQIFREELEKHAQQRMHFVYDQPIYALAPGPLPKEQGSQEPKLPRVLVVGPRNGQQTILCHHFKDRLDLRFVSEDEKPSEVTKRGLGCDLIALHVSRISHQHAEHAQRLPVCNLRIRGGGTHSIVEALENWVGERTT